MELTEVYRSSVNTWECDEMGHMNVRFYVQRAVEGLQSLAQTAGFGPRYLREVERTLVVREQHIRFHKEMRPGTPFFIRAGVTRITPSSMTIYEEVVHSSSAEIAATFVSEISLASLQSRALLTFSHEVLSAMRDRTIELPENGRPRGIAMTPPRTVPSLQDAEELKLYPIYRGVVAQEDVDNEGFMQMSGYMAAISNGITNFFIHLRDDGTPREDGIGGAALEYRFIYHQTPKIGDILVVHSGLKGIQGKASSYVHWMFNAETGECVATAEAVAVSLDLKARKAVALPDNVRDAMLKKAIPNLSV